MSDAVAPTRRSRPGTATPADVLQFVQSEVYFSTGEAQQPIVVPDPDFAVSLFKGVVMAGTSKDRDEFQFDSRAAPLVEPPPYD